MPSPVVKDKNSFIKAMDACLPIFSALAAIIAIRLFLLFAIVGAFTLAYIAMADTTNHGIYVLGVYCAFTILPLVWLDILGKRNHGPGA